jgi:hypothetical protein
MAVDYCIMKPVADKLKQAFRDKDLKVSDLYNSSSEERHAMFSNYMPSDIAHFVNTNFEKAMVSRNKESLLKWFDKSVNPKEAKSSTLLSKLKELDDVGQIDPNIGDDYLMDLVADKMGITLKPKELEEISIRAQKLQELSSVPDPEIPSLPVDEYFDKLKEMNKYINSLSPSSTYDLLVKTVRRGSMLFNVNSPVVNFLSNSVLGGEQAVARRLAQWEFVGDASDLALKYVQKVNRVYWKTGYDLSRMESLAKQAAIKGEQVTHAEGPGPVRAYARWMQDFVFSKAMNDTPFASLARADSMNLAASKLANGDKAKARELFIDATRIEPLTDEGKVIKAQGIADALLSTWNNKGAYADFALGLREAVNKLVPGGGDFLMPFVKTSADVIEFNIDAAGVGFPRGIYKIIQGKRLLNNGNAEMGSAAIREGVKHLVDAGLGMTAGFIIANMANPDDFVSVYDTMDVKESQLAALKNAPANSIKFGGIYLSLDFLGPFAASTVGWLYARKYGNSIPEKVWKYAQGAAEQVTQMPGVKPFSDTVIEGIKLVQKKTTWEDALLKGVNGGVGAVASVIIPGILGQVARATDPYQRYVGKDVLSNIKSGIPGLREQLQPKVEMTSGDLKPSEGFVATMFFGSRVKTANTDEAIKEIQRLYDAGYAPVEQDLNNTNGRVAELKKQISPEEFTKALQYFGSEYGTRVSNKIKTAQYKILTDEQKMESLNAIRTGVVDSMMLKFHYKKPLKPK